MPKPKTFSSCIPYVQRWTNVSSDDNLLNKSELLAKNRVRNNSRFCIVVYLQYFFFSWRAIICQQKQILFVLIVCVTLDLLFSRSSHQINERSRSGEGFFDDDDGSLKVKTQEKKKSGGNWNFYKTKLEVWKGFFSRAGRVFFFFNVFSFFSILSRNRVVEVVVVFNSFLRLSFSFISRFLFSGFFDVMIMMIRSVTVSETRNFGFVFSVFKMLFFTMTSRDDCLALQLAKKC